MLHCSSLVLRDGVRCDMNFIFFLFSLVSDFFGKKESVDANVGTTTALDEQPAQSGTAVLALVLKGSTINGGGDSEVYSQLPRTIQDETSRQDT